MIARKENKTLKIKTNFNLFGQQYKLEGNFALAPYSLMVEIEMMKIVNKDVISLEIIATGFEGIKGYKKFIITKDDLSVGNGKIMFEDVKDMYLNNTVNKQIISSIIVDTMITHNPEFFNEVN